MKKMLNSLSEEEYLLVLDTKKDRTAELDEDDLIALHSRVRRARNKYTKNYRQAGAEKVREKKARGSGKSANARNAGKAEIFEDAPQQSQPPLGDGIQRERSCAQGGATPACTQERALLQ